MIQQKSQLLLKNEDILFQVGLETKSIPVLELFSKVPKYATTIKTILPFDQDPKLLMGIYENLIAAGDIQFLSKISEFYLVSAYLIRYNRIHKVCSALRRLEIDPNLLINTSFSKAVSETLLNLTQQILQQQKLQQNLQQSLIDNSVLLMGVFYNLAKIDQEKDLMEAIPKLTVLMFGDLQFRMPAFLCCAAFINSNEFIINREKVNNNMINFVDIPATVKAAAYYVTYLDSSMIRREAAAVLKRYVSENGVNLNICMKIFMDNVKESDESVQIALNAFASVVRVNQNVIDPKILKRMSEVYDRFKE